MQAQVESGQEEAEDNERVEHQWSPAASMDGSSQSAGGKEQTAEAGHQIVPRLAMAIG